MGEILAVHHICVETSDIEESLAYYQEKLGFTLIGRENCSFGAYAMLKAGEARVELIEKKDKTDKGTGAIAHVGFEVDNVEELFEELKQRGVVFKTKEVERADEPLGGLVACSTVGPSGEVLSFYHFLKSI